MSKRLLVALLFTPLLSFAQPDEGTTLNMQCKSEKVKGGIYLEITDAKTKAVFTYGNSLPSDWSIFSLPFVINAGDAWLYKDKDIELTISKAPTDGVFNARLKTLKTIDDMQCQVYQTK